jgi:hypothetical protein
VDICAAPGKARGAIGDHVVAGERDTDQIGLRSRLPASYAPALWV